MITSPDMLRRDTAACLSQINKAIENLEGEAASLGMEAHQMRDANSASPLAPLLLAKVIAINTLADLNYNLQARSRHGK